VNCLGMFCNEKSTPLLPLAGQLFPWRKSGKGRVSLEGKGDPPGRKKSPKEKALRGSGKRDKQRRLLTKKKRKFLFQERNADGERGGQALTISAQARRKTGKSLLLQRKEKLFPFPGRNDENSGGRHRNREKGQRYPTYLERTGERNYTRRQGEGIAQGGRGP